MIQEQVCYVPSEGESNMKRNLLVLILIVCMCTAMLFAGCGAQASPASDGETTEVEETGQAAETDQTTELAETGQAAETDQTTELAEAGQVTETDQTTEVAETGQAAETDQTTELAETDQVAEVSGAEAGEASGDDPIIAPFAHFEVLSSNINDGKWDDVISNTSVGENKSPALSWEPVEGATRYVIYMVDTTVQNWIHWKSEEVTETELPEGWASSGDYVGPYPPEGGTHTYEVYVIALKNPVERVKGGLDGQNAKFASFVEALDTDADGNTGNIAACGHLAATFTH